MLVQCSDCGLTYVDDDSEDVERHIRRHEEVTAPDRPKPDPRVASLVEPESGLVIFEAADPDYLHYKLDRISNRFKREMGYDQAAWAPKGSQIESGAAGVLFCEMDGKALGGAGIFKGTLYKGIEHVIGWIWIAPSYRRAGVFTRALPSLVSKYPGALIHFPYSPAMMRLAEASDYIVSKDELLYLAD